MAHPPEKRLATGVGKAVYWDAANSRFDLALADGSVKQNCVGFADVPNAKVYSFGDAVLFSGLTPGSRYYLDASTAGSIVTAAPENVVLVGIARTATEVFVDIDVQLLPQTRQLQPILASVSGNALTLTLSPTNLEFRSSAQASGVVNKRAVSAPISLTIPAGATLGSIGGVSARLVVLAIDNGGTVELAVVNLMGGSPVLDETNLINTTAISASANTSTTVYAAASRGSVPYRVVGFVDITEAAAGTWATAPTLVQGVGGQALAALSSLGYGQTWQNVTGSRAINTTYYNTTGKPILVSIAEFNANSGASATIIVNGVTVGFGAGCATASQWSTAIALVPHGASYSASASSGTPTLNAWAELR